MPAFALVFTARAERQLAKLPTGAAERLIARLEQVCEDPRGHGVTKLSGREGYRVRAGDYRALFTVDDAKRLVAVVEAGHRSRVYDR